MGFPTSGNGTITGNGSAGSRTAANLPVMVLTHTQSKQRSCHFAVEFLLLVKNCPSTKLKIGEIGRTYT